MSKMSTEKRRFALNGPCMGTRWTAAFFADSGFVPATLHAALQAAVDEVDAQMSTWKPDSDLIRLNAAPLATWIPVPARLGDVLRIGLEIGRASGGAFDIGMGDAVTAWGFGSDAATAGRIEAAMTKAREPAHLVLDWNEGRIRKRAPIALDLNGIAKGYGVDRLAETIRAHGIVDALVGIDGELRALGMRPDGAAWGVAIETPEFGRRAPHAVLAIHDVAVATSGDYRHWVEIDGRRLSHTMDPRRGAPLLASPASVTVVAPSCAEADAWATALMVVGPEKGRKLARANAFDALFLMRGAEGRLSQYGTGGIFGSVHSHSSTITEAKQPEPVNAPVWN